MQILTDLRLADKIGQLRAAPVCLGGGREPAFLSVHGPDFDVDPCDEMFFYPTGTLELIVATVGGEVLWRRDLGRGVVPGMWFCPVFPFDLNGDGVDEIWFVGNPDPDHPLAFNKYRLYCLDAVTGQEIGHWPWAAPRGHQSMSHAYRHFLLGGYVRETPVLVTAQGTYGDMALQGWDAGMRPRWQTVIGKDEPGARGSHMSAIVDWDGDGIDEVFWGERLLELDRGTERLCVDRDNYAGHSDVVQPVFDPQAQAWCVYTCRETEGEKAPRVALYDHRGNLRWGDLDRGHIDMGWVGNPGGRALAMAIRIHHKTLGPGGRFHHGNEEFVYDLFSGERVDPGFSVYGTFPVDVDGDGRHELVRGRPGADGALLDGNGKLLQTLSGTLAMASKFCGLPGEQILMYTEDGHLQIWHEPGAKDSPEAAARYENGFYRANQRLTASGYNLVNLGGLFTGLPTPASTGV